MIIQQLKSFYIACTTSTGNEFGDRGATSLSEALKVNTTITKLNLSCENRRHIIIFINNSLFFFFTSTVNDIGDTGAISLGEALKSNKAITKLNLGRNTKARKLTIGIKVN